MFGWQRVGRAVSAGSSLADEWQVVTEPFSARLTDITAKSSEMMGLGVAPGASPLQLDKNFQN